MEENTITISSMTFGFSDSEDRLWLRLTLPDESVQYWLTRRFVLRWYKSMAGALFDTVQVGRAPAPNKREVCAGLEYHEAIYGDLPALSTPCATIVTSADYNDSSPEGLVLRQVGLLNSMEIQASTNTLSFFLSSVVMTRYFFEVGRFSAYRMLQVVRNQITHADWDFPTPKNIRHAWCEASFMAHFKDDEATNKKWTCK